MSGILNNQTPVPITYSDTPMFDAFGRLRVSEPQTLFDSKLLINSSPHLWDDTQTSGSGTTSTYSKLRASATLAVSAATAGKRVRQSKRWWDYQPGKSQLILVTFVMGAAVSGVTKRIGYHNDNNGIFFQQTATDLRFVIRSYTSGTPVDTNFAAQANWNIDKLDGTGPSRQVLDITKSQIMFIEFEWLGVGRVKVGFVINGLYVPCHEFLNANINASVYMATPNLPVRYSIENNGTGGVASIECICAAVISEGGRQFLGYERAISRQDRPVVTNNNADIYPILAMRLNGSYLGAHVHLDGFSVACTTSSPFNWFWIENPTLVGGSLIYSDVPNSAVQVDFSTNANGSITCATNSGTLIKSGVSSTQNEVDIAADTEMQLGSFINGTSDVWVLAVQRLSVSAETFYGAINWRESGG